jgi:homoserine kinase
VSVAVGRAVTVDVPASSANLGVGFDCLALALDLHLRVSVEVIEGPESSLSVEGEGRARLALDESNRFMAGLRAGWREADGGSPPALAIAMDNEIPLGRGLGSSAAATVAGLVAAETLIGAAIADDRLIELAAAIEGHPDNAAAALLGGFVLFGAGRATGFDPPPALLAVVFVPERELATSDMRAVLPEQVPLADAVANAAGVGALVAAFAGGELSLLRAMSGDRLHEPYRAAVYPELPLLKAAALRAGALGCALSGAGSSVIALADQDHAQAVALALDEVAEQSAMAGTVRVIAPTGRGAVTELQEASTR